MNKRLRAALGAAAIAACALAAAQSPASSDASGYPKRPIRIVLAFSGGVGENLARIVAERLEHDFGQPVIVEPHPGASGNIASELVARAPPDGYTLLLAQAATTLTPATHGARAVDPIRSFAPVARLGTQPWAVVAHHSLNADSLQSLLDAARTKPGRIGYATPGIGTSNHLSAVMLWSRAGVSMLHVPYSNSGAMMKDVITGEVPVAIVAPATAEPYIRTGQVRLLATTGARRTRNFPDVPTVAESGFPGFEIESWYGLVAPAGTPDEIVARIHREVSAILDLPVVRERLLAIGIEPAGATTEQFREMIRGEVAKWAALVRAAGIGIDK